MLRFVNQTNSSQTISSLKILVFLRSDYISAKCFTERIDCSNKRSTTELQKYNIHNYINKCKI